MGNTWGKQDYINRYLTAMGYREGKTSLMSASRDVKSVKVFDFTIDQDSISQDKIHPFLPLAEWIDSEEGQWVKEHSLDNKTTHYSYMDHATWNFRVIIVAQMKAADVTFYLLKYPKKTVLSS